MPRPSKMPGTPRLRAYSLRTVLFRNPWAVLLPGPRGMRSTIEWRRHFAARYHLDESSRGSTEAGKGAYAVQIFMSIDR